MPSPASSPRRAGGVLSEIKALRGDFDRDLVADEADPSISDFAAICDDRDGFCCVPAKPDDRSPPQRHGGGKRHIRNAYNDRQFDIDLFDSGHRRC